MSGIDIVIDDGSHHMADVRASFEHLFPKMKIGGLYLIEDLHTSFWRSAGGGYRSRRNFLRYITKYILGMHHWYHGKNESSTLGSLISSIHIYDSIVVFKKEKNFPPTQSRVGDASL
jgi:hypothetical protein